MFKFLFEIKFSTSKKNCGYNLINVFFFFTTNKHGKWRNKNEKTFISSSLSSSNNLGNRVNKICIFFRAGSKLSPTSTSHWWVQSNSHRPGKCFFLYQVGVLLYCESAITILFKSHFYSNVCSQFQSTHTCLRFKLLNTLTDKHQWIQFDYTCEYKLL